MPAGANAMSHRQRPPRRPRARKERDQQVGNEGGLRCRGIRRRPGTCSVAFLFPLFPVAPAALNCYKSHLFSHLIWSADETDDQKRIRTAGAVVPRTAGRGNAGFCGLHRAGAAHLPQIPGTDSPGAEPGRLCSQFKGQARRVSPCKEAGSDIARRGHPHIRRSAGAN